MATIHENEHGSVETKYRVQRCITEPSCCTFMLVLIRVIDTSFMAGRYAPKDLLDRFGRSLEDEAHQFSHYVKNIVMNSQFSCRWRGCHCACFE